MELKCEVCGSLGLEKRDGAFVCPQCGMRYSLEEMKKQLASDSPAQTEAAASQPPAAEPKKKSAGKLLILGAVGLGLAAAAAVAFVLVGLPRMRYAKAEAMLREGDYNGAVQAFTALGDYADSAARLREAERDRKRVRADELFEQGQYAEALELYESLAGDPGVEDVIRETKYRWANRLFKEGRYSEALELFEGLAGYNPDVPQAIRNTKYSLAIQLLDKGEYSRARELFEELEDYYDSEDRLLDAKYGEAEALYMAGDYEAALPLLKALGNYPGAGTMADLCTLKKGKALYEEGRFEEAYLLLYPLKESPDAMQLAANCAYEMQMGSNRFEKRTMEYVTLYTPEQLYALGKKALENRKYTYATDFLRRCPWHGDSVALLQEALLGEYGETKYSRPRDQIWALYEIATGAVLKRISVDQNQGAVPCPKAQEMLNELARGYYDKGVEQIGLTNWGSALKQLNVIKGIGYLDTDELIATCNETIVWERSVYNGVWREHTHFWTNLKIVDGVVYYSTDQTDRPKKEWYKLESSYNEDTGELQFTYMSYRYSVSVSGKTLTIRWINKKDKWDKDWFGKFTKFDLTPGWS